MKKPWIYLQNPILNATENSFRKAYRISLYHDSALNAAKSDAFILTLYNSYHPLHLSLQDAYNQWSSKSNQQQGNTLSVEQLFDLLANTKIKAWDVAIQNLYPDNSTTYKSLLPNRRGPFQKGSQNDRLVEVKTLGTNMTGIANLATVKTDVDNFYTTLSNSLTTQKGSISTTKTNSDTVETARIAMAIGQYANLGALINKNASNPGIIDQYFDLNSIRSSVQDVFTGILKPLEIYLISKHTFKTEDEITLDNPGNTPLQFWLSATKKGELSPIITKVEPGQTKTITAPEFGPLANKYIYVQNLSDTATGNFEINL